MNIPFQIFRVCVPDGEYDRRTDVIEKIHYDTLLTQLATEKSKSSKYFRDIVELRAKIIDTEQKLAERDALLLNIVEACEYGQGFDIIKELALYPSAEDKS